MKTREEREAWTRERSQKRAKELAEGRARLIAEGKCLTCEGDGKLWPSSHTGSPDTCPTCHGTGKYQRTEAEWLAAVERAREEGFGAGWDAAVAWLFKEWGANTDPAFREAAFFARALRDANTTAPAEGQDTRET